MSAQERPMSILKRPPVPSDAEWGSVGYRNWWGGFHRSTDPYLYWTFFTFGLRHLLRKGHARVAVRWMRDRWRHRRCDTVDFHHYACTLDKFGKRLDDDYRWKRVWADRAASQTLTCADDLPADRAASPSAHSAQS